VSNPQFQDNLGKNARKLLERHYTIDQAIPKYIDALRLRDQFPRPIEQNQLSFYKTEKAV
jgi:hypothetical protein